MYKDALLPRIIQSIFNEDIYDVFFSQCIYISEFFFWQCFAILLKQNVPSNMVKKNCHILKKNVIKSPRFLEDLCRFLVLFFRNFHI